MAARRPPVLLGRASEREALDRLLENVRGGQSAVLVIRGEAGVGKTALLHHCARQASGFRVARVAGVESEMELPFAGLHQLCAPMLGRLGALPEPQQAALGVALGLSSGGAPDRFLVALAALSLLAEVAGERPLLCFVDDAQWLDAASSQVLGFVARRLLAESVAIVFAVREPTDERELAGLPELALGGLPEEDAHALLATVIPGRLDVRVRDRLVAETRGNPLAILELPRALAATQVPGGYGLDGAYALPGRIEESFVARLEALPQDSRLLLLVAAAEPLGDPLLLLGASERLGIAASAVETATDELLALGERVTFRHPLVRSAVYRSAALQERRAAHLALAQATDRDVDPDRRAWHLAAAAAGPDEQVALELERSAGRAQARGGLAAAAAFLQRAVALTGDAARRADRALAAAEASLQAGVFDVARRLMATAEVGAVDELQRARLDLLRAEAAYSESRGSEAPALLLRAAKTLDPLDPKLARDTYLDAWSAALFAGRLASTGSSLHHVSREALTRPRPAGPERPSDLLLQGFSLAFTDGRAAAAPLLERAASGFAGKNATVEEVLRWGWLATAAAVMVWDYETCVAAGTRGVLLARESGALTVLAVSANVLAQAMALGGESGRAASLIAEADSVTEATGTRVAPYGALVLAGLQGREAEATTLIDATIRDATAGGQGTAVQYAHWARSILLNGLGRYQEALAAAKDASDDTPELFVSVWALSELIEAAARSEDTARARRALERLVEATGSTETDWGLGIAARSRALLSEGETADRLHQEAIERLGRTRLRPELARAHLLYGEWLRREGRRVAAREQLRTAHEMLAGIGMEAFAERARRELLATGEKVRKRTASARDELTGQEQQIAGLARDGLTNPEIGARLFLSSRTVEWHLGKVFAKLGITSRMGLRDALPSPDQQAAPA
jgi:DNA-binding CsgD family transcriptional regulator